MDPDEIHPIHPFPAPVGRSGELGGNGAPSGSAMGVELLQRNTRRGRALREREEKGQRRGGGRQSWPGMAVEVAGGGGGWRRR